MRYGDGINEDRTRKSHLWQLWQRDNSKSHATPIVNANNLSDSRESGVRGDFKKVQSTTTYSVILAR